MQALAIGNDGDLDAADFRVRAYLSTDEVLTGDDLALGGSPTTSSPAGAIGAVDGAMLEVPTLEARDYFLLVVADADGQIVETNEDNNTASVRVQVSPFTAGEDDVALAGVSAFQWRALGGADVVVGVSGRDRIHGGSIIAGSLNHCIGLGLAVAGRQCLDQRGFTISGI